MEKVDLVKRLIRSHNYIDTERVFARCKELGIHVNKTALYRFSAKLALIDKAQRHTPPWQMVNESAITMAPASAEKYNHPDNSVTQNNSDASTELLAEFGTEAVEQINTKPKMTRAEARKRETEITFELGAMKIKEHALLEELNQLAKLIDNSH